MTNTGEGVAWLAALATQYEETARAIRDTMVRIQQAEAAEAASAASDRDAVSVSEAIRLVLGPAKEPLKAAAIWREMQARRILLRTRSADPANLVASTLSALERSGQVRRRDGGWVLAG